MNNYIERNQASIKQNKIKLEKLKYDVSILENKSNKKEKEVKE